MDKLLHTSLYRAILKSLNRKATSEKGCKPTFWICQRNYNYLQQYGIFISIAYIKLYPNSVPILTIPTSWTFRATSAICIPIYPQSSWVYPAGKELLYYRLEHPRLFISDPVPKSSLYWSKQYHAIDLSEILCTFDLMNPNPLVLVNGRAAPFNTVIREFEQFLHVKLGEPSDIKRRVLDRKGIVQNSWR